MTVLLGCLLGVAGAQAQTPLTNGGNHDGTIGLFETNEWTFMANAGDTVVLRSGQTGGVGSFYPWLRLLGTGGVLLADSGVTITDTARELALTLTNSGTFTVLVSDGSYSGYDGTGTYRLHYFKIPGAFSVADDGGALTNGGNHDGTISIGDVDGWTFTADTGDTVVLRSGQTSGAAAFYPWLRLYDPNGALLADSGLTSAEIARELALTLTNSGTFTVLVSDGSYNGYDGTGTYRLHYFKIPGAFSVADDGGALTNGANHDGTIAIGDVDGWTFAGNAGDSVVLRLGQTSGADSCYPWVRLYDPNGALLADSGVTITDTARELALTLTTGGTFTVLVSDGSFNGYHGTGTYRLHYFSIPGAFLVADDGGTLTNGGNHDGTISIGDVDGWTFAANAGDSVVLRVGQSSGAAAFYPWLRLYDPDGVLLADSGLTSTDTARELALSLTNSGTFTVLMSDGSFNGYDGTGDYRMYLFKVPGNFIVADEGGSLVAGQTNTGTIFIGDLDVWSFTACEGDWISLQAEALTVTNSFYPWLRVYDRDGVLVQQAKNTAIVSIGIPAPNTGSYRVLLGDGDFGGFDGSGAYRLVNNGLSDGLKLCPPRINGAEYASGAVGGLSGATFVYYTTTNLALPVLWQAVLTNQFNQYGIFEYTNVYNPTELQRYFLLEQQ